MVARKKHKCHLVDTESESEDLKDFVRSSSVSLYFPLFLSFSLSVLLLSIREGASVDREEQEEVEKKMGRAAGKRGRGRKE